MMRDDSLVRYIPGLVLLLVFATGCRTYGGYGIEEEMVQQMQQAVQQFANELDRARSDLKMLAEAAQQNQALESLEARYRDTVERHEAVLDQHRRMVEHFEEGGAYRELHRSYGAMITEQRVVRNRYGEMHTHIARIVHDQDVTAAGVLPASRYVVNPLYYERVENRQALTMREALQGG